MAKFLVFVHSPLATCIDWIIRSIEPVDVDFRLVIFINSKYRSNCSIITLRFLSTINLFTSSARLSSVSIIQPTRRAIYDESILSSIWAEALFMADRITFTISSSLNSTCRFKRPPLLLVQLGSRRPNPDRLRLPSWPLQKSNHCPILHPNFWPMCRVWRKALKKPPKLNIAKKFLFANRKAWLCSR